MSSGETAAPDLGAARTLLFAPGHRPDRFDKAASSGADAVVLDLEDAVAAEAKDDAREHVRAWLAGGAPGVVRVNAVGTPWYEDDVAVVAGLATAVMLPKADPSTVADVRSRLPASTPIIPLLETARGIDRAAATCAVDGVVRPAFGSVDLAAELGVRHDDHHALATARSMLVLGAAAAGVRAPLDGVCTTLDDEQVLADDVREGLRLGMGGKLCIHPRQIATVHAALAPSEADIAWARRVTAAAAHGGATAVDGQMVDKPVLDRARALLSRTP